MVFEIYIWTLPVYGEMGLPCTVMTYIPMEMGNFAIPLPV
jgi:hypothetical protein